MNYSVLIAGIALSLGLFYRRTSEKYVFSTSDRFEKLRKYRKMIKDYFRWTEYCRYMGMNLDFNHFKYKEPTRTGLNCNHNLSINQNYVIDHRSFFGYCYYLNMHENKDDITAVLKKNYPFDKHFFFMLVTMELAQCRSIMLLNVQL